MKPSGSVVDLTEVIAQNSIGYARLANNTYSSSGAPPGFTRLTRDAIVSATSKDVVIEDANTGFQAVIYQNNHSGEVIVSFRGSDTGSLSDIQTDWLDTNLAQGVGYTPDSYMQGAELARTIKAGFENVRLTGHSMGGGVANYAAILNNLDYFAFNAAGLSPGVVDEIAEQIGNFSANGTVINDQYDPLTNMGGNYNDETWGMPPTRHIGYDILVFVTNNNFNWLNMFNMSKRISGAHMLEGNIIPSLERMIEQA
jgi:hypothetical protein